MTPRFGEQLEIDEIASALARDAQQLHGETRVTRAVGNGPEFSRREREIVARGRDR